MAAARPERSQDIELDDQPVVLWIAFPLSLVALLMCSCRPDTMGAFANGQLTNVAPLLGTAAGARTQCVSVLRTFGVAIPGCPGE